MSLRWIHWTAFHQTIMTTSSISTLGGLIPPVLRTEPQFSDEWVFFENRDGIIDWLSESFHSITLMDRDVYVRRRLRFEEILFKEDIRSIQAIGGNILLRNVAWESSPSR